MKLTLEESIVTAGEQMEALNNEYESCLKKLERHTHMHPSESAELRAFTLKTLDRVLSEITILRYSASLIVKSAIREAVSKMDKQQPANSLVEWKAYCNYAGGYRVEAEDGSFVCSDLSSSSTMKMAIETARVLGTQVKFTYWAETPDGIEQEKPFGPPDSLQGE
jgi:hypothetical protein